MWRIHFSDTDLTRVRLASGPDPLLELLHSVHVAVSQSDRSGLVFGRWQRRAQRLSAHHLQSLLPLRRAATMEDMRSVRAPALHAYFRAALAPYWPHVHRQVSDQLRQHASDLAAGGIHGLLGRASPHLRWEHPVLMAGSRGSVRELVLDGSGLLLQPTFFSDDDVTVLRRPGAAVVLAYPVPVEPGWCREAGTKTPPLDRLLGPTRAKALAALAHQALGTSQLARSLDISVPAASLQAKVLRDSGLVISRHEGKHVIHRTTALGLELLAGCVALGPLASGTALAHTWLEGPA